MMFRRSPAKRGLASDRRGIAAVEFALIAPALIVFFVGVFEVTFRFRASEEATRYVHQVADLISREHSMTTADLTSMYNASINMMKPLDTTSKLDLDVVAVQYTEDASNNPTQKVLWRRTAGAQVPFTISKTVGLGQLDESVIWVGIRYRYESPVTSMFGGSKINMVRESFARPRALRLIKMDGSEDHNGASKTIG